MSEGSEYCSELHPKSVSIKTRYGSWYFTYDLVNEAEVEWKGNVSISVVERSHHMGEPAKLVRRHEIVEETMDVRQSLGVSYLDNTISTYRAL